MKENKISVIIITKDEEKMLPKCLQSLNWVNEIIVVDNDSTDKTVDIAKKYHAKVFNLQRGEKPDFSHSRNVGLKHASGEWVLYIDADERVESRLELEIKKIISTDSSYSAYAIPRRNFIFGKEFKYGGQRPDYVKRLFKKEALAGWHGKLHEEPEFQGKMGHLKESLVHIKHETLTEMVVKTNEWSEIEADLMLKAGHPKMNVVRFISAMAREFWFRMVRQVAFLDGPEGIIYATYQVFSRFTSYAKLWERQIKA